jgi:hypothetical protein
MSDTADLTTDDDQLEDVDLAERWGHGPCLWCRRQLRPHQHPRPADSTDALVARANFIAGRPVEPCTWCGRQLEADQPADPAQDLSTSGQHPQPPSHETACKVCDAPIPYERGRPPSYCSEQCRSEARRRRKAA